MDRFSARFFEAWTEENQRRKYNEAVYRFLNESSRKQIFTLSRLQNQNNFGLLEARALMRIDGVLEDLISNGYARPLGELISKHPFADQKELLTLPIRRLF